MRPFGMLVATAALLVLTSAIPAWAEHFEINITVNTPRGQAESHWDTTPPIGGVNPRPVVTAKVGDRVDIDWLMRSEYPHGVLKGWASTSSWSREHAGAEAGAGSEAGKWMESRIVMDFLPDHAARGSVQLTARTRASTCARGERRNGGGSGARHFSAIDLQVE